MKKFSTKILLVILTLLAASFINPIITAKAVTWVEFVYEVNEGGTATVMGASYARDGKLVIPETIDGYPVTHISDFAFTFREDFTSVTIPASVIWIGSNSFGNCTNLKDVYYKGTSMQWSRISIGNSNYALFNATLHFEDSDETSPTVPEASVPSCLDYEIEDSEVKITYCDNSASGELVIPEYIDGYPVTRIDDLAFFGCADLTAVIIPDSVTTIGTHAFEGCSGLTEMTVPDSVTRIEDFLFAECTGLTSVTIPDGVTSIGLEAFIRCSGLTVVDIPDSVTSIEEGAFNSCTGLTSVVIPDNVTSIGNGAFYDCSGLTSVRIGGGVTDIGDHAFYGCSGLTSVLLPNLVTSIGPYAFDSCTGLTQMTIPGSVSSIGEYAFVNCSGLTSVTIENGVTGIGEDAFQNCISLTSITIPDSVTYIGPWAFNNCAEMTSVSIGNGVTCIGNNAFRECFSLTSVTIGNSVEIIERGVFSYCTALPSVVIPDSVRSIGNGAFYNCSGLTDATIGSGVTDMGSAVFIYCSSLTDVTISDGVTRIGDSMFAGCYSLTSVTIPDSVTSVGSSAFADTSLTSIIIPDSVTDIEGGAFSFCYNLTSVTIGAGATYIDRYAFEGCENLAGIWVDKDNECYSSDDMGVLFNKDQTILVKAPGAISGSYAIPYGVTEIGENAFENCFELTSVVIPDSVTDIKGLAFSCCTGLTSAVIGKNVTNIEFGAFMLCENLAGIWVDKDNECYSSDDRGVLFNKDRTFLVKAPGAISGSYTVPYGVTGIEEYAFQICAKLTSVVIPESVADIGYGAFLGCSSLTGIRVDEDNIHYSSDDRGVLFNKDQTTIMMVPGGIAGSYSVPDRVVSIANGAFIGCGDLTAILLPNSVTDLGNETFGGCTGLTSVTIPGSVTNIGDWIFINCTDLTAVIIPDSVTNIGIAAFAECYNLTDVYYTGTQEQWDSIEIAEENDLLYCAAIHYGFDVNNHNHIYGEWSVSKLPTFTAAGQQEKSCTVCGDTVSEIVPVAVGRVFQWNITLENDFRMNFYLDISESIESTVAVKLMIGDYVLSYPASELERDDDGMYILSTNLSAAQMNENILVMVINGREIGSNAIYSVRQYCDTILADETYGQYHTIVKAMLNYGAMAQMYFNYDTENLANDCIDDVAKIEVPETAEDLAVNDGIRNMDFYGASLVFLDRIAVRYYFAGDVSGCTFTVNDNTYEPTEKDGMHYVEIADILPQDLDQRITLIVTDSEGNTLSVTYGPMNYIVRMNKNGSYTLQNLVKALYNYHLATKEFSTTA